MQRKLYPLILGETTMTINTTFEVQIEGAVVGKAKGLSMRVKIKEKYPLDMKL